MSDPTYDSHRHDSGDLGADESHESHEGLEGLAIVGLSGRFPGADDAEALWSLLREGRDAIATASAEELRASGVDDATAARPEYVPKGGFLSDVERFDAGFFGINPRDARVTDPQHRLFLEESWKALENAGYGPGTRHSGSGDGAIGVYGGMNMASYLIHHLLGHQELLEGAGELLLRIHNDKDFLCSTVAYRLGLTGPAVTVQGACATSLMAVCLACQGLLSYQCDMALAGGVSVRTPVRGGYVAQEGVYAPDGRCRAFDAEARGTVLGNGVGVVVLKRLEDALADGDTIRAVVRGFAMNNDGAVKAGYTAPSVDGQAEVVAMAQGLAGVDAGTITYVEAHGTGTPMGDPIEVEALTRAFRETTDAVGHCGLGSVKTNIGHLDAAAGIASLIKTVLALEHRHLPPSLGFETPNPEIPWATSPFRVVAEGRPWEAPSPLRAGVSAFAVGGVNAHLVVEEAPPPPASPAPPRRPQLLVVSAKSRAALDRAAAALARSVEGLPASPDLATAGPWADVAHTLADGRQAMRWRRAVVADPERPEAAVAALRGEGGSAAGHAAAPNFLGEVAGGGAASTVFLLPGLGEQRPGVAGPLYASEPVFRLAIDEYLTAIQPHLAAGIDLRALLLGDAGETPASPSAPSLRDMVRGETAGVTLSTAAAQPMMAVLELALARLWRSWGVEPTALLGFSVGEFVAAALAGVFSDADALVLVAQRAALLDAQPAGVMTAVGLSVGELGPEALARYVASAGDVGDTGAVVAAGSGAGVLTLAAEAAPQLTVVAGPAAAVERLEAGLAAADVVFRRLATGHAFHTPMLEPAVAALRQRVAAVPRSAPTVPVLSAVTGTWLRDEEAVDPDYWARQAVRPVRFAAAAASLRLDPRRWALLEVGPGQTLASWVLQQPASAGAPVAVPSLGDPRTAAVDPAVAPLAALGRLWVAGVEPNWEALHGAGRRRVPLPSYPFEGERHWVEPGGAGEGRSGLDRRSHSGVSEGAAATGAATHGAAASSTAAAEGRDLHFSIPLWRQRPALPRVTKADAERLQGAGPWLVMGTGGALEKALERALAGVGAAVARAELSVFGDPPEQILGDDGVLRLGAGDAAGHEALLSAAASALGAPPRRILHLGPCAELASPGALPRAFHSPLLLCRALATEASAGGGSGDVAGSAEPPRRSLIFVTAGLWSVTGAEPLEPERALVLGPARVAPQEVPGLSTQVVDLEAAHASSVSRTLISSLLAEALHGSGEDAGGQGGEPSGGHSGEHSGEGSGKGSGKDSGKDIALRGRHRWIRELEAVPVEVPTGPAEAPPPQSGTAGSTGPGHPFAPGAPWLITGGLGGVGLTLARRLWLRCGARLALLGRSGAPDGSSAAAAVAQLRQEGAEVLVLTADVTDGDALTLALGQMVTAFGSVAGVVHAAGEAPGGLLSTRTIEAVHRVLAPKVEGTRRLLAALEAHTPRLVVLCSSLTGLYGAPGLVDHAAGNAYLDAVAQEAGRRGPAVVAVDWDTWLEVGQAARAISQQREGTQGTDSSPGKEDRAAVEGGAAGAVALEPFSHPLLQHFGRDGEEWLFTARLETASCWPLREHRLGGQPTLPGTTVLDLLWAAAAAAGLKPPLEVRDLTFLAPLTAPSGVESEAAPEGAAQGVAAGAPESASIDIRLRLIPRAAGGFRVRLESWGTGDGGEVTTHVRGKLRGAPAPASGEGPLPPAPAGAPWQELALDAPEGLELGPRWQGQRARWSRAVGAADARLSLAVDHADDLEVWAVHPALMDRAIGAAVAVAASGGDPYLPMAYERVVLHRPLPSAVEARTRFDEAAVGRDTFPCDLWVLDAEGAVVMEIDSFLLRRVAGLSPDALSTARSAAQAAAQAASAAHLLVGLMPERGADAFDALTREPRLWPQVAVSVRPLAEMVAAAAAVAAGSGEILASAGELPPLTDARPRPPLAVDFVAPRGELEERLADLWERLLGVEEIGVEDGFFDLGGDSLLATRLLTHVSDAFGVRLGLRDIFEHSTVAAMARRVVALEAASAGDDEVLAAVAELKGLSLDEARALLDDEGEG